MITELPRNCGPGRDDFGPWFITSISKLKSFEECPRAWYHATNTFWGGWERSSDQESKLAYRLTKLENLYGVAGKVVGETVYAWLEGEIEKADMVRLGLQNFDRQVVALVDNTVGSQRPIDGQAMPTPFELDPKRRPGLEERYYVADAEWRQSRLDSARKMVEKSLEGATKSAYLQTIKDGAFGRVHCETGELRTFTLTQAGEEDLEVYTMPDIVLENGTIRIIDLKAGQIRPEHHLQVQIYAIWAQEHYQRPVKAFLVYLAQGERVEVDTSEAALEAARAEIFAKANEIRKHLVDPRCNYASPDLFPPNYAACGRCKFFEVCHGGREQR